MVAALAHRRHAPHRTTFGGSLGAATLSTQKGPASYLVTRDGDRAFFSLGRVGRRALVRK